MIKKILPSLFLATFSISAAAESNFYIFPIIDIEGLETANSNTARPLINKEVVDFLNGEKNANSPHAQLGQYFKDQVITAYPASVVHPKQVCEVLKGPVKYDETGEGSVVPVQSSFAAVLGLSRASMYKVEKGQVVELLVPVTLNLQIVKPDKDKIVFAISNTRYAVFNFAKSEIGTEAYKKKIQDGMAKEIKVQIDDLVRSAKENFNPKVTLVKVIGKDGNYLVVDKGFEVGFESGDEPEVKDTSGKDVAFKVVSADDGYAVIQSLQGDVKVGQEFNFLFAKKADDSNKPRVMPVTTEDPAKVDKNGIIDVMTKSIGFKAPFQLAAVDVNFKQTMASISTALVCGKVQENLKHFTKLRQDVPPYLLTVDYGETDHFIQSGSGGVLTNETFSTVVQAKITDLNGLVVSSAVGTDKYQLKKTAGIGLTSQNAREVSFQNSTKSMTDELLKSANFQPKEFKVKSVDPNKHTLIIENLPAEDQVELGGSVYRKLSVRVGKNDAYVKYPVHGIVRKKDKDIELSWADEDGKDYFKPKSGDTFVIYSLPKGGAKNIDLCDSIFVGRNNTVLSNFAAPLVSNVIFNSPKFQVRDLNGELVANVNYLLTEGFFDGKIHQPSNKSSSCLQPGYLIREEKSECKDKTCSATVADAIVVKELDNGTSKKEYVSSRVSQLTGFDESQKSGNYSTNAFDEFIKMIPDLSKKINSN